MRRLSLFAAMFVSGGAALVYQATWGRMLHRVFGVGDLAVATVLASFFLGLGLGSWLGGRWGRAVRRPATAYAGIEAAIGVYALVSLWIIPRVHTLYGGLGGLESFAALTGIRLALALAILLPPTVLMGATLPLLVGVVSRVERDWTTRATGLYAVNTIGAVLGAGASGLWVVPAFGTRAAIVLAAVGNFLAAVAVFVMWRRADAAAPERDAATEQPGDASERRAVSTSWLALGLAGAAGFAALASEVLWTRVLRMIVQGTTQAFAAMLVCFLGGIAIGSVIADRVARRPGRSAARTFGVFQLLLAAATVVAMMLAPHLPRLLALLTEGAQIVPHRAWVILVISAPLLLPIAVLVGSSVPLAWRIAAQRTAGDAGTGAEGSQGGAAHTGRVLAANTIGGLAGSLIAGFVLVPLTGIDLAIVSLVLLNLLLAAVALRAGARGSVRARSAALAVPAAAAAAILLVRPSVHLPFLVQARHAPMKAVMKGLDHDWREQLAFLREGRNTTVTVLKREHELALFNDGRPESGFAPGEPGFGPELATLGGLPVVLADQRKRAMAIGLGAGHSSAVLLAGPWKQLDVVELEPAIVDAARMMYRARGKPFPVDDPRARLIVDDARARLVLSPADHYDAIVSQPSHPWLAGSAALYTKEFFEDARRVLRPGGVLSLWLNLFRIDISHVRDVVATVTNVFPHVQAFVVEGTSLLLVAGEKPMPLDGRVAERLSSNDRLKQFLGPHQVGSLRSLAAHRALDSAGVKRFAEGGDVIVDDRPSLEFDLPSLPITARVSLDELDEALHDIPWISPQAFRALPQDARLEVMLSRMQRVEPRKHALGRVERSLAALPLSDADRKVARGALAEARGDVERALEQFDAAGTPLGATRADRLRHAERMHRSLVEIATARGVHPETYRFALSSAMAIADAEVVAQVVTRWQQQGDPRTPLFVSARAFADGGCEALLDTDAVEAASRRSEHGAALAQRCAFERDRQQAAQAFAADWARRRRSRAANEARRGHQCREHGNEGAAVLHLRRALAADPAAGAAAAELAEVLHEQGRDAEAAEVLRRAHEDARGIPEALRHVADAARKLGFELGVDPAQRRSPGAASPTSTAPSVTEPSDVSSESPAALDPTGD